MGIRQWYEDTILPRMIRCACSADAIMELRAGVVPKARGRVFELGCGGGINQQFYDADAVTAFAGLDPSGKLLDYARAEAERKGWQADIREGVGEAIPFADDSFDTVVCTYTLCSVGFRAGPARNAAHPEAGRAVAVPRTRAGARSRRAALAAPAGAALGSIDGGCHLTRPVIASVRQAGCRGRQRQRYMPKMPRWASWMEWGSALKTA
jgi:SAM-dependent methyltransferase